MQFSVVVPTFNYAHYLKSALDSLFEQDFEDFEIVVIDDGSTDNTQSVVTEYIHNHPNKIRYFYQQNAGPAAARNFGLQQAQGEYLIFLDADDVLAENALTIFFNALKNENVDLIVAKHYTHNSHGKIKESISNQISSSCEQNFKSYIRKKISIAQGAYAVRKSALREIKFLNVKGREDIVFFALMFANLSCNSILDVVITVNKHADSLRHTLPDMDKTLLLVSLLFEHQALPSRFKKYRNEFESRLCLSLFRQFYSAHEYQKAREIYQRAIKLYPAHIFLWTYFKRFVIALFK